MSDGQLLLIALGAFTLYEDDGISQRYLSDGGEQTNFRWDDAKPMLIIESGEASKPTGRRPARVFRVRLLPEDVSRKVEWSGERLEIAFP